MNSVKPVHKPSLVQLGLSLLVSISLFLVGGILILAEAIQLIKGRGDSPTAIQNFSLAAGLLLAGMLVLPSAWYAFRRLRHDEHISSASGGISNPWLLTLPVLILVPLALFGGEWIVHNNSLAWLLLPGISVVVTGLPILWLVLMAKRELPGGSLQRQWGLFAAGLVFSPLIMIVLEMAVLIGLIVIFSIFIAFDPELMEDLSSLAIQLENTLPDPALLYERLTPYIQKPVFLGGIFFYTAVLVPLIEEALKPLGLWLLARRQLTPQQGFVGGVISAAGFAFFENLTALSTGGEDWAILAGARISTAVLHMLTSGMMGWALANAWSNKHYLRLAFTYAFAVGLHGLWNALGVSSFVFAQNTLSSMDATDIDTVSGMIVIGLAILTTINLSLFFGLNRRLRVKACQEPIDADLQSNLRTSLN